MYIYFLFTEMLKNVIQSVLDWIRYNFVLGHLKLSEIYIFKHRVKFI